MFLTPFDGERYTKTERRPIFSIFRKLEITSPSLYGVIIFLPGKKNLSFQDASFRCGRKPKPLDKFTTICVCAGNVLHVANSLLVHALHYRPTTKHHATFCKAQKSLSAEKEDFTA
jgi:hypothetical protein